MSFNPCSRGCFARSWYGRARNLLGEVSILVLVDVSLEDPNLYGHFGYSPVSILVLVDVSLEDCLPRKICSAGQCFNPCSRGCFARRRNEKPIIMQVILFQSLFSWMFRSKAAKFCVFSAESRPNRLKFLHEFLPTKLLIPI